MQVQIGTIFASSWGYDQTNVDFYEVVKVTKASVVIREIAKQQETSDGGWTGYVNPRPGEFSGEAMTRRLKAGWDNTPGVKVNSCAWARLWDGKPQRFTSYA
jgi:acetyl-CoA acetyltransferase